MSDYDNTNRGSIWKNDKQETERHPDFKGAMDVEGVEYWVSAWKRKPDANPKAPALTFSFRVKEQQPAAPEAPADAPAAPAQDNGLDDDIPF